MQRASRRSSCLWRSAWTLAPATTSSPKWTCQDTRSCRRLGAKLDCTLSPLAASASPWRVRSTPSSRTARARSTSAAFKWQLLLVPFGPSAGFVTRGTRLCSTTRRPRSWTRKVSRCACSSVLGVSTSARCGCEIHILRIFAGRVLELTQQRLRPRKTQAHQPTVPYC